MIEQGKIMQLHGLSASQWNGCIVDVGKRSISDSIKRYSCEVIMGESKGKKISVKRENLMELLLPPPKALSLAKYRFAILSSKLETVEACVGSESINDKFDEILNKAEKLILIVPNCAALWYLIRAVCKYKPIVLYLACI